MFTRSDGRGNHTALFPWLRTPSGSVALSGDIAGPEKVEPPQRPPGPSTGKS
jgi:hypothetical protein